MLHNVIEPIQEKQLSDDNLNIRTLTIGQRLLNDLAIFPEVLDQIILEYCAIYRIDHMKPYSFESVNEDLCEKRRIYFLNRNMITPLINESIQNNLLTNKDPMIWLNHGYNTRIASLFWSILIEHMVRKEIECKENNIQFNIIILCSTRNILSGVWNMYINYRCKLNESWLHNHIAQPLPYSFQTSDKFNVIFTSLDSRIIDDNSKQYDLLITDVYEKGLEPHQEFYEIYKITKKILYIGYWNANILKNIQQLINVDYQMKIQVITCKSTESYFEKKLFKLTKELLIDVEENKTYTNITNDDLYPEPLSASNNWLDEYFTSDDEL